MLTEKRCMGCMSLLDDNAKVCSVCGYEVGKQNAEDFLAIETELSDRYVIGKVESYNGSTVRYVGFDKIEKNAIYIHEFFPSSISCRGYNGNILAVEEEQDSFDTHLKSFRQTVRATARLRDLSIMVPVFDIFEENNTIYAVSEYIEMNTLEDVLKQSSGKMSWEDTKKIFIPFLSSLESCHAAGLYHFGICPSNIIVTDDGKLKLIGFDIPRVHTSSSHLKPDLHDGYSAPEQYAPEGELSPATDVYGMCAVLFRCLTGNTPPKGSRRQPKGDDLLIGASIAKKLPEYVANCLSDGLQPRLRKRIATIEELKDKLNTGAVVTALAEETKIAENIGIAGAVKEIDPKDEKKKNNNNLPKILAISLIAFIALIAIILLLIVFNDNGPKSNNTSDTSQTVVTTTTQTTVPTEEKHTAPDVVSSQSNFYDLTISNGKRVFNNHCIELAGYKYSSEDRGTIVEQEPRAGAEIGPNDSIYVYISAGQQPTTVPDVTGWNVDHAKLYLEALGFRVELSEANDSSMDYNAVVGTWPSAFNPIESDNRITLRVNKTEPTTAPSLSQEDLDGMS